MIRKTGSKQLTVVLLSFAAFTAGATQHTYVRGTLVWNDKEQTITDCQSRRVYWVRVLASNPNFMLTRKVDDLMAKGANSVIAELRGEASRGASSVGPGHRVDGTLDVREIVSVARGSCDG